MPHMDYNKHDNLDRFDDDQEPLIKFYNGISFRIDVAFEPGLVKYTAYPTVDDLDPGMKLSLDVEYIEKPDEDDVDDVTLEYFHQMIVTKLFEMADSARQQNIQSWVGLQTTK